MRNSVLDSIVIQPPSIAQRAQQWLCQAWRRLTSSVESGGLSEEEEERRLIAAVQHGGKDAQVAFRRLVELHQRWLVWFLTCLLTNRSDAEDVAQEVFVRSFLSIGSFRGNSKFRTWLRRIAINQAFNHRRAHVRHAADALDESWEASTYDRHGEALAARDALLHCMQQLPYVSREILVLHHVEELSVKEVARTLNIGVSAAKMRLKRARDSFRDVFGEEIGEETRL